ncbi:MAG: archaeal proteasome endopeptidase complex subunit alpha [Candidatus Diapherotrites archaeon]|nr:archaeal proteasome endopeptidase complex subunit alpha [Candidatus Diapherotrites archaeon]
MYPLSQTAGYDRVATMFSPDGRLYQVEYASKIVSQGTLGVAVKYNDGIIFGADKRVTSKLIVPESIEKMFLIDNHIMALSAGLVGDARRLAEFARQKAQENIVLYSQSIEVETLVKEISSLKQLYTQYGGGRPFGVSFIIGGIDATGKRLFETEPSGALAEYHAIAIGRNREKAMEFLEKDYNQNINYDDAIILVLKTLKFGLQEKEKLEYKNLEFSFIEQKNKRFTKIPNEDLKQYLAKV